MPCPPDRAASGACSRDHLVDVGVGRVDRARRLVGIGAAVLLLQLRVQPLGRAAREQPPDRVLPSLSRKSVGACMSIPVSITPTTTPLMLEPVAFGTSPPADPLALTDRAAAGAAAREQPEHPGGPRRTASTASGASRAAPKPRRHRQEPERRGVDAGGQRHHHRQAPAGIADAGWAALGVSRRRAPAGAGRRRLHRPRASRAARRWRRRPEGRNAARLHHVRARPRSRRAPPSPRSRGARRGPLNRRHEVLLARPSSILFGVPSRSGAPPRGAGSPAGRWRRSRASLASFSRSTSARYSSRSFWTSAVALGPRRDRLDLVEVDGVHRGARAPSPRSSAVGQREARVRARTPGRTSA